MPTYLIMGKYTRQGIHNVKQTIGRVDQFREIADKFGVKVKDIYWLLGEYDVVNIVESDDESSISALMLELGAWGNVSTTTMRAYSKEDMDIIISKMNGVKLDLSP